MTKIVTFEDSEDYILEYEYECRRWLKGIFDTRVYKYVFIRCIFEC